jgi:hypothetical protein
MMRGSATKPVTSTPGKRVSACTPAVGCEPTMASFVPGTRRCTSGRIARQNQVMPSTFG